MKSYSLILLLIVCTLATKASSDQTIGQYWGANAIKDMQGNPKDIIFVRDFEVNPNQLLVWRFHCKSITVKETKLMYTGGATTGSSKPTKVPDLMYVFLEPKQIMSGTVIPFYFGGAFSSANPKFLRKEIADNMPFSTRQFSEILTIFGFEPASKQAKAIFMALHDCEMKPNASVIKFCASSYESMVENIRLVHKATSQKLKFYSTSTLPLRTPILQNYTLLPNSKEIEGSSSIVACHLLPYPYALYYCHRPAGATKAYQVPLVGVDGTRMDAIVSCHLDTANWDPEIEAFGYLGTKPGQPVCHVIPPADLVWVSNNPIKA